MREEDPAVQLAKLKVGLHDYCLDVVVDQKDSCCNDREAKRQQAIGLPLTGGVQVECRDQCDEEQHEDHGWKQPVVLSGPLVRDVLLCERVRNSVREGRQGKAKSQYRHKGGGRGNPETEPADG